MAGLLPYGFLQFLDANGNPLAGGNVAYFEPASPGTFKQIWADADQTVIASNPVTLNSAGRPETGGSEIGIFGIGSYRMIVSDFNGALQWSALTYEPLSAAGGTINGNLTVAGLLTALNATITANLTVNGTATLQTVNILSGTANFTDLTLTNNLTVAGTLTATNINSSGALTVGSLTTTPGGITSAGTITGNTNMNVAGIVIFGNNLTVSQDLFVNNNATVSGNLVVNSQITSTGPMNAPAFNVTSDHRLKTVEQPSAPVLDLLASIPVRLGRHVHEPEVSRPIVLAHEVARSMPWAVSGDFDAVSPHGIPRFQTVNTWDMVIALVGAVKELNGKIAELESRVRVQNAILIAHTRPNGVAASA